MKTKNIFLAAVMGMMTLVSTSASAMGSTTQATVPAQTETQTQASTLKVNIDKYDKVSANTTDVYTVKLYAGEDAYIYVEGDGDTDLDIFLYDENGNLIDSDTDELDDCLVTCCPKWTGTFKLKIKNLGDVYNRYRLRIVQ